jgi:ubiquinone/menaquinone biosynthesis C-methylase UbiE
MSIGKFDTNSAALRDRIALQSNLGKYELNDWIFSTLDVEQGMTVLDLGCGLGKQSLMLAKIVGDNGNIISLDVSSESLSHVERSAQEEGVDGQIETVQADLDHLPAEVMNNTFDRIVASYSIYYVQDPKTLFQKLNSILRPGGQLFFCGPQFDNNLEIRTFIQKLKGEGNLSPTEASVFMEDKAPKIVASIFAEISIFGFENPIDFNDAPSLCRYWNSHNMYAPELDDAFKHEAEKYFSTHRVFRNVKRAIGLRAVKKPSVPFFESVDSLQ